MKYCTSKSLRLWISILLYFTVTQVYAYADLLVENIIKSGGDIEVSVKNQGDAYAGYSYLRVNANGYSQYIYLYSPAPGTSVKQKIAQSLFNLSSSSGIVSVSAYIDYFSYIYENNEANNSKILSVDFSGSVQNLPDLIVEDISYESGFFKVTYKNQGTANSSSYFYLQACANLFCRYAYVSVPASGTSSSYYFYPSDFSIYQDGTWTVTTNIDYYSSVIEANESNNILSKSVLMGSASQMADLVISDIVVENDQIKVRVKNQGQVSVDRSQSIQLYNSSNGATTMKTLYASVAPNQIVDLLFSRADVGVSNVTSATIRAWADYYNEVVEVNDNNNLLSKSLAFSAGAPDLVIDSISTVSDTSVKVVVKNIGSGPTSGSHVTRLLVNNTSKTLSSSAVIAAGGTFEAIFLRSQLYLKIGENYSFTADADYNYTVVEASEVNNQKTASLSFGIAGFPDLRISSVVDQGTTFQVTIENNTNFYIYESFDLLVTVNGQTRTFNYSGGLQAGFASARTVYKSDLNLVNGSVNSIKFKIDGNLIVSEALETNNEFTFSLDLTNASAGPDLQLKDIYLSGDYIYVKYSNNNTQNATSSYGVTLSITANGYTKYVTLTSIAPGEFGYSWYKGNFYLQNGVGYAVSAKIDHYNDVGEINENNNSLSKTITVGTPPASGSVDLVIENVVRYDVSTYRYALITWKNQGTTNGTQTVTFKLEGPGSGEIYFSQPMSQQTAGVSNTTYIYLGAVYSRAPYSMKATIDYDNKTSESNETNNVFINSSF